MSHNLNELNKITGNDLGTIIADIERFAQLNKQLSKELCPSCGDCNKECDNCEWCGTAPYEKESYDNN